MDLVSDFVAWDVKLDKLFIFVLICFFHLPLSCSSPGRLLTHPPKAPLSVRGEGGEWESGERKTVQYGGRAPHKNYWYLNDLFFTHRHLIELDIIHCSNNNNKKMNRRRSLQISNGTFWRSFNATYRSLNFCDCQLILTLSKDFI